MGKCKYEFSFKIETDEPIRELKIKLVDKNGNKPLNAAVPVENKETPSQSESKDDEEHAEIPPEMMMEF
ncbi:MAG: hypothetical protein MJZ34_03210 [Paludibacteraceae bacterium]|nr:hypothetical protein [Paludibacteraceae bacterium]